MKNLANTIKAFAITTVAFAGFAVSAQQHAVQKIPSVLHIGVLEKIGSFKVRVDNYGEPAALPIRVSASIHCGLDEKATVAFDDVAACDFVSLQASGNQLVLNVLKANGKTEKCTEKTAMKIANVCRK